jgi:putative transposase
MVQYRRNFIAGATYFFTVTIADRHSSILTDQIDAVRAAFRVTCHERPFAIDAIVILPDHLHVVMNLPIGDADFSGRWRRIKSYFTSAIVDQGVPVLRDRRGEFLLWQRRFWEHTIRDERDFERHVDYIHYNPVKHGLVNRVRDWPLSSFHRFVRGGDLSEDWAGSHESTAKGFGERRG